MPNINLRLTHNWRSIVIRAFDWDELHQCWYVRLLGNDHPFVHKNRSSKTKLTHVVYWLRTGERVMKGEVIHHIDHNPQNNLFENFERLTRKEHAVHHHTGLKRSAKTIENLKAATAKRVVNPGYLKKLRARVKKQHAAGKFGPQTWKKK